MAIVLASATGDPTATRKRLCELHPSQHFGSLHSDRCVIVTLTQQNRQALEVMLRKQVIDCRSPVSR